jgi:pimeloyl-ACP methyl ester carboxylesterase
MMTRAFVVSAVILMMLVSPATADDASPEPREISYETEDGITIYGDVYDVGEDKENPMVLLFHQAGGNARAEYGAIIPVLLDQGYAVLAIDQRNGGSRLGGTNRTVEKLGEKKYGYCEAYPDLAGALDFVEAEGYTGPRAVWGSSYSAALVIQLGAEHGERIAAVLAFSPASGDPLADCLPEKYSETLEIPALMLRPASEMEREKVKQQLELFGEQGHQTYVAGNGVHGSSMLNPERVGADVGDTWAVVNEFLEKHLKN